MMWVNHICYILLIVLNDSLSFGILAESENNYNCNGLFSSEQCVYINALKDEIYQLNKQIKELQNTKCEVDDDVKSEIIDDVQHNIRETIQHDVKTYMLGEFKNEIDQDIRHDIRSDMIDELSDRLFNISGKGGQKQQVKRAMNSSWYATPHESTARLLTPAKNYLESWNAFISKISTKPKSSSTYPSTNHFADRVYFEEVSNTFAAGTAGVAVLVAIASIGVGLGIGGQIHQTLQNTDGVDQNAREAMSLVERLSIVEDYVRENKKNIEENYQIITHLVIALKQTCERLDLTGATDATSPYDCCISAESTASIHDRAQMVCGSRAAGVNLLGIDTATICPVCPSNLIGARRR